MNPTREPRSKEQAAALLEEYADVDAQITAIADDRKQGIADVNARCDRAANDLITRREAIRAKLEPWWAKAGAKLTEGKRKSIELGGCMIGSRAGAVSLKFDGTEQDLCKKLLKLRWGKAFLRVSLGLGRPAILKALDGSRGAELQELGFAKHEGAEIFVLERVQQSGTLGGA